jgi:hypothetical protein
MKFFLLLILLLTAFALCGQDNKAAAAVECAWSYILTDEFSGKEKRALLPRRFFGYTPEAQRRFFLEQDYLECEGYLIESDGKVVLHLRFTYQDKEAEKQVGTISPGATITLSSLKGKLLTFTTFKGAEVEKKGDLTIYESSYAIPKSAIKTLKNFEINTILVNWSKGIQTYEVYYVDFLSEQLRCLE